MDTSSHSGNKKEKEKRIVTHTGNAGVLQTIEIWIETVLDLAIKGRLYIKT